MKVTAGLAMLTAVLAVSSLACRTNSKVFSVCVSFFHSDCVQWDYSSLVSSQFPSHSHQYVVFLHTGKMKHGSVMVMVVTPGPPEF